MRQVFRRIFGWAVANANDTRTYDPVTADLTQTKQALANLINDLITTSLFNNPPSSAPANTTAPIISGTTTVGQLLTATAGVWTGYPIPTITRQWKRDGVAISAATGNTYTLQTADIGSLITIVETGTNASGSVNATSNALGPIISTWLPSDINASARWFLPDVGISASGSANINSWVTKRDNRNWGDWIGRDSVFTYVDGPNSDSLIMYGGWSNANVASWNNQFLTNEVWISFDKGVNWEKLIADEVAPTTRPGKRHLGAKCYATFNSISYIYMMGGKLDVSGGPQVPQTVDVWRKPLGDPLANWQQMTANAGVGARDNMFMGELDGVLYAGGGYTGVGNTIGSGLGVQRDLWKSTDQGATWSLVTATCPWGPTAACGQHLLKRNGKLWLFGGWEATTQFAIYTARNSVWTFDGTNFVEVLADGNAQWPRRFYHSVEIDSAGNFVILGGHDVDGDNVTDSGFYSADGITWTALPTKPHEDIHAPSVWVIGNEIIIQNGYVTNGSGIFSYGVFGLSNYATQRVDSWAGQGAGGLSLTATSTARPYYIDSALAPTKKTVYFDAAQYMNLAGSDSFSGSASILIAGRFPNFATGKQAIVSSAANVQFGIQGVGPYATDSSSDNVMARAHARFIQSGPLRCFALTMDGSECRMRVDGDLLETDGEAFALSSWSRVGGGYTATNDNLKGHITAIVIVPNTVVSKSDFDSFQAWAFGKAGILTDRHTDVSSIQPDQLLLQDGKLSHYTVEEEPTKTHLLRDHSLDYRSGVAIPGFAPQNCLTGDGGNYASLQFGSYFPGRTAGPIEVEFSLKTPDTFSSRSIMCSINSGENLFHWLITIGTNGKLTWYNRTHVSGAITTAASLSVNTWYRIKYVRTGSASNWTIAAYINGVLDSTTSGVTANPATVGSGQGYLFDSGGAFSRFIGSVADVRFTHDGHKWYIPLTEGTRPSLLCYRSDGLALTAASLTSVALWAGIKTEPASMCPNWLLKFGGKLELGQSSVYSAYLDCLTVGGNSSDDRKTDFFASKFSNGTINCDPLALGGGLGLETALTPSTDRKAASSSTRRRRAYASHVDRLAAKATAMSSTTANEYFRD